MVTKISSIEPLRLPLDSQMISRQPINSYAVSLRAKRHPDQFSPLARMHEREQPTSQQLRNTHKKYYI